MRQQGGIVCLDCCTFAVPESEMKVKEYSRKQQPQPPHARVMIDLDSSSGECAKGSEMRLAGVRSVEDVGCSQHLQEAMAQQVEVMKSLQSLLKEQSQMQAQIEAQHANLIRMLAASEDASLPLLPLRVSGEEEWAGRAPPSPPSPPESIHLNPFQGLEEEHLDIGLLERGGQEAGPAPADSIDLQQLLLLHPDLLRHPHFLHQVLALSGTLCSTPPPPQQMYPQQQQQHAVHLAAVHQFEDTGVAEEAESASLILIRQLQKSLLEEQLKEQIQRQVQLQQLLLCQLAASQQGALERMPMPIPPVAPHFAGNTGWGAGGNGTGMGYSSEGLLGTSRALWG